MAESDLGPYVRKPVAEIVEAARLTFVRQLVTRGTLSAAATDAFNNALQVVIGEMEEERAHFDVQGAQAAVVLKDACLALADADDQQEKATKRVVYLCAVTNGMHKVYIDVLGIDAMAAQQNALHLAKQCAVFNASDKLTVDRCIPNGSEANRGSNSNE